MKTLEDLEHLPKGDKTYTLLMYSPTGKDQQLSDMENDVPFLHDDYTWAIPRGEHIYFVNAYLNGETLKIEKKGYKKLYEIPRPEMYPENEKQTQENSASGMRFHESYIDIAKNIDILKLDFKNDELLNYLSNERLEKIISQIEQHEHPSN